MTIRWSDQLRKRLNGEPLDDPPTVGLQAAWHRLKSAVLKAVGHEPKKPEPLFERVNEKPWLMLFSGDLTSIPQNCAAPASGSVVALFRFDGWWSARSGARIKGRAERTGTFTYWRLVSGESLKCHMQGRMSDIRLRYPNGLEVSHFEAGREYVLDLHMFDADVGPPATEIAL